MYYPGDKCIKCHFYNAFLDRCECPYDLDFRCNCLSPDEKQNYFEYVYPVSSDDSFISLEKEQNDDLPF